MRPLALGDPKKHVMKDNASVFLEEDVSLSLPCSLRHVKCKMARTTSGPRVQGAFFRTSKFGQIRLGRPVLLNCPQGEWQWEAKQERAEIHDEEDIPDYAWAILMVMQPPTVEEWAPAQMHARYYKEREYIHSTSIASIRSQGGHGLPLIVVMPWQVAFVSLSRRANGPPARAQPLLQSRLQQCIPHYKLNTSEKYPFFMCSIDIHECRLMILLFPWPLMDQIASFPTGWWKTTRVAMVQACASGKQGPRYETIPSSGVQSRTATASLRQWPFVVLVFPRPARPWRESLAWRGYGQREHSAPADKTHPQDGVAPMMPPSSTDICEDPVWNLSFLAELRGALRKVQPTGEPPDEPVGQWRARRFRIVEPTDQSMRHHATHSRQAVDEHGLPGEHHAHSAHYLDAYPRDDRVAPRGAQSLRFLKYCLYSNPMISKTNLGGWFWLQNYLNWLPAENLIGNFSAPMALSKICHRQVDIISMYWEQATNALDPLFHIMSFCVLLWLCKTLASDCGCSPFVSDPLWGFKHHGGTALDNIRSFFDVWCCSVRFDLDLQSICLPSPGQTTRTLP